MYALVGADVMTDGFYLVTMSLARANGDFFIFKKIASASSGTIIEEQTLSRVKRPTENENLVLRARVNKLDNKKLAVYVNDPKVFGDLQSNEVFSSLIDENSKDVTPTFIGTCNVKVN